MYICTHCLLEFVAYRRDAGACVDVAALRTFASVHMGVCVSYDAYKRETTNAICIAFLHYAPIFIACTQGHDAK